jgi:hypothetical protein
MSTEKQLCDLITQIEIIYTDYNNTNTPAKKIQSYKKCEILLKQAKTLIEELKSEIIMLDQRAIPVDKGVNQAERANVLVDLIQIPNTNFDSVRKIIEELKSIYNGLPTSTVVIDNVESEIVYDELVEID